jgi:hypothetical protein
MIIDEAGMANTRLSARLLDAAIDADVKVVAFGDSGQLSAVQAGGWFGALTRHVGSYELREVMRQRDPQERRGLAQIHRGEPDSYLQLKFSRGELEVFQGERPGIDAERAAIQRWAAARETHGPEQAVMICRDNQRRERLNHLARERLQERSELGDSVQIAGREWAVGDRVIAGRNDRGRDLDNGMRATVTAVDPRNGLTIQADTGGLRLLDLDYTAHHLQHAYALTGHGIQGGTVQWAAVIGQAGDFTRNWSYTALSRAREPTEILLIDELSRVQEDRSEIAPLSEDVRQRGPVERMAARMRERDDEDLALEQLEHASATAREHGLEASRLAVPARFAWMRQLEQELDVVNTQLLSLNSDDAKRYTRIQDAIASVQAERARVSRQREWRDRSERKFRAQQLERDLRRLVQEREELLDRTPDPEAVRERIDELTEQRSKLSAEHRVVRDQVIAEQLERRPAWLERAVGPEPADQRLQERWHRTARDVASYRLDQDISDPNHALGPEPETSTSALLVQRAISETRARLGLEPPAAEQDRGYGLDP